MLDTKKSNAAERFIVSLVTVFFVALGWLNILQGGIALAGKSGRGSFVTGQVATGLAIATFCFAALLGLLLAKSFSLKRATTLLVLAAILVPPVIFGLLPR